jgi:hypothetical protein
VLVLAGWQRDNRNKSINPILLFRCQILPIGRGWDPVVTNSSLDGHDFACAAFGRNQIEDTLALSLVLDEYHNIVVLFCRDLKTPDGLAHVGKLLDRYFLLIGRNPEQVGNVRWQGSIVPLFKRFVHCQGKALRGVRRGWLLRVRQRERYGRKG